MTAVAIRAESLWKEYVIGAALERPTNFREAVMDGVKAPLRRFQRWRQGASEAERIWALRDVGFEVKEGEVVGIIGRNGAGKSTLLKVLSRITPPTRGRAELRGRVASLLEVGTGFHPELTGRENVYLNGAILGMSREELDRKFDEIVAFAEVEKFLDTPVKRYSTGMAVRLAFAVAAHLEAEILVVDEVLSVGDARFRRKCLGRMGDVSREGRTVLFVSHNLGAVSRLCNRGIVLSEGGIVADGGVREAIREYSALLAELDGFDVSDFRGPLGHKLVFHEISINGEALRAGAQVHPADEVRIRVVGEAREDLPGYRTTVCVHRDGQLLISRHDAEEPRPLRRGTFASEVTLPAHFLSPGEYGITFGGYTVGNAAWTWSVDEARFTVLDEWAPEYDTAANMGLVNLPTSGRRLERLEEGE